MKVVVVHDDNDRDEQVTEQVDALRRWGGCVAVAVHAQHKATLGCPCVDAGSPREYCWVAAAPNCRFQKPNRSDLS